jgi:hypothetical protein
LQVGKAFDGRVFSRHEPKIARQLLLVEAVLGDGQRLRAGANSAAPRQKFDRLQRDIFELVGGNRHGRRKGRQRRLVIVRRKRCCRRHVERRAGAVSVDMALEAKPCGGHGQHAAKLTAAENTNLRAGRLGKWRGVECH